MQEAELPGIDSQSWNTLLQILDQRVSLRVTDAPLEEVVRRLSALTGVRMLIDVAALDDLGLAPDEPVTWSMQDVRLQTLLEEMLGQLALTWCYRNETLFITTEAEADLWLFTRVYPIGDLLSAERAIGESYPHNPLIDLIVSTIATDTWAENGGGEADIRPLLSARVLVISQTEQVHLAIQSLLDEIRRVGRWQGVALWAPGETHPAAAKPRAAKRTYIAPANARNLSRVYSE